MSKNGGMHPGDILKGIYAPIDRAIHQNSRIVVDNINAEDVDPVAAHARKKEGLLLNFLIIDIIVLLARIVISFASNSMSMYTTAVKAGVSVLTALISYVSIKWISRGENDSFNYGYGKVESISSILKASALLLSFAILVYTSVARLSAPVAVNVAGSIVAVAFLGFVTCGGIYRWTRINRFIAHGDRSPVLWSQSKATISSVIVNAGSMMAVLCSLLFMNYSWAVYIDPAFSIMLSAYILITAYTILSGSMGDLLDKTIDESMQLIIVRALAEFFDEYTQILGVRSRRSGGMIFIEIQLEFETDKKMGDVQSVIDRMQRRLEESIKDSKITIIPRAAINSDN
jgi:cation diffusion facilitator family transporter